MSRLIIVGTASTLNVVPWDLKDVTYWACAPVITHPQHKGHRIDALFEMHEDEYCLKTKDRLNDYTKDKNTIVYMRKAFPEVKNCTIYPLATVQSFANHPKLRNYFTSTIAYMAALGISCGKFETIEYYGVHMSSDEEEYSIQRSCLESWINFGWGRGVDYWFPEESDVMKTQYLYGYEQSKGLYLQVLNYKKGYAQEMKSIEDKLDKIEESYFIQKGAVMGIEKMLEDMKKKGMR